ncbi:MAG: hypothetical protein Q9P01_06735 [Anaerolineae bacterium]|nr:hypothetical protein [Anaerolineae bacterium]MDQ7034526.1 hypothetical protein [Anaerolineae bacterium]
MDVLATLYIMRRHLGFADSDTAEDARLLAALEAASTTIERRTRRHFTPRIATLPHSINRQNVRDLMLNDDLLELQSLTNGDGTSINISNAIVLSSSAIRLSDGTAFIYSDTPEDAVFVTGIWGYHPDWTTAWADSGDSVQDSPLSAVATTITVNDVDAANTDGTPRFQVGQVLRIETEYVRVLAADTTLNTLTVARGINSTTAASHVNGTAIDIYQPPMDVVTLCLRWALWLYKEPDAPAWNMPPVLLDTLDGLRRISVKS